MIGTTTYLLIALAVLVSAALSYFFYNKQVRQHRYFWGLLLLRFFSILCVLLLLINPKYSTYTYTTQKPSLHLLLDNSTSIANLNQQAQMRELLNSIQSNSAITEQFDIHSYAFDKDMRPGDSLNFEGAQTDITSALESTTSINGQNNAAIILLSDGNQTYGRNYSYSTAGTKLPVFPVVLGDTTSFNDLQVSQLNVNRYAYYKNQFPVEAIITFKGKEDITSEFAIYSGDRKVYSEKVSMGPENTAKVIHANLDAVAPGIKKFRAVILPLEQERNKNNNTRNFAVEVIDQKKSVAIISSMNHPDIGALKRMIESSERHSVQTGKPANMLSSISDHQLCILYQPDASFRKIMDALKKEGVNYWIISGKDTDWNFINTVQSVFYKESGAGTEEVFGQPEINFSAFITEDPGFDDFPPLEIQLGDLVLQGDTDIMLMARIGNIVSVNPMLVIAEGSEGKTALLDGEGFWKWRSWSYVENGDFELFDTYFNRLIQYLASNQKKDRLTIQYDAFYDGDQPIGIRADYFDRNFSFDPNARVEINIKNEESGESRVYPMSLNGKTYEVDLSNLPAGNYDFTVGVPSENLYRKGKFTKLEFDVERQFLDPDLEDLNNLANRSGGSIFYPEQVQQLADTLLTRTQFKPIQRSTENVVPLIEWWWLLLGITFFLGMEWLLRKYNGLI
ncbi:VWA domain-containing protein [Robertkochia solimangrovi]|nr:VWA domain-containing protein [Robertkochia solimangrovi]